MKAHSVLAALALCLAFAAASQNPVRAEYQDSPALVAQVQAGQLPPLAERLPDQPAIDPLDQPWQSEGRHGGRLTTLMAKFRDLRQMVVYGYARLVGYTPDLALKPDLLAALDVEEERVFTLHLRPGHKWSDGHPFTTEDFRYWWEEVANNEKISPTGPPVALAVEGEMPKVEILDAETLRYSWSKPNPTFLHELAKARPLYLYRPAHYLKQFHADHAEPAELDALIKAERQINWAALHNRKDNLYKNDNVDLPSLQPWVLTTRPPSERFVFARNPYYHRIDPAGRQLPYIDEVVIQIANTTVIPAKTGAGETDLQARYIRFDNYTFLKAAEERDKIKVDLWRTARGARLAIYLNLNVKDAVYRALFHDVRFRRALSLAIDRHEINQVVFYGLATEGNNTVLPDSPLFKTIYQTRWTQYDLDIANLLLDDMGLAERDGEGMRLLSDGRPLDIIVETAGESSEEADVLELIRDSWSKAGIKLYTKPSQREVFRNRIYSGETQAAIWIGLENAVPSAAISPVELAPTRQTGLQWPRWGQYFETKGQAGEPPTLPKAIELMELYKRWTRTTSAPERAAIWHEMLAIHADQIFSLGLVANVPQPIVYSPRLRNLPQGGLYNWNPGAYFGLYRPDTFWFEADRTQ